MMASIAISQWGRWLLAAGLYWVRKQRSIPPWSERTKGTYLELKKTAVQVSVANSHSIRCHEVLLLTHAASSLNGCLSPCPAVKSFSLTQNFALHTRAAQNYDDRVGLCAAIRCGCEHYLVKFETPMAAMRTKRAFANSKAS